MTSAVPDSGEATNGGRDVGIPGGFYPFWFWNGELQVDEIRRQVSEMSAQGIKGFYIHPRQGLQTPYLSSAFFEMVDAAVAAARDHGLVANLYDEYPYPSGAAGGETVLGDPAFLATKLVQEHHDVDGGQVRLSLPRGKVLCCRAFRLGPGDTVDWTGDRDLVDDVGMVLEADSYNETGLTAYNRKRYFASRPTPVLSTSVPPGRWRVHVAVQAMVEKHKYWAHYIDVLNPEAMRHFMDLTHERYARHAGEHFGSTIRDIFVDETAPGWSRHIPRWFLERFGYDLLTLLPALQERTHPRHFDVSRDLATLRYERFCESVEEPIGDWCKAHSLRYAGEKPSLRLSQLQYMDVPGCDPGHTRAGDPMDLLGVAHRSNARATASAAYFYGKDGALCECYHSLGWGATLQDAKTIADGLLLMGIRYLVPHGFFYSTHALRKHDAPPSFFFQMPFWPLFRHLAERIDAILEQFEGTHIDAPVLVVDPTPGLPTTEDGEVYQRLQALLMEQHIDFLTVDTDILDSTIVRDGKALIRDIGAALVIVPPMQIVEPALQSWLDGYASAGGRVMHCQVDLAPNVFRAELLAAAHASLTLEAESGDAASVQLVTRCDGDRHLWFLLNTSSEPVTLKILGPSALNEFPLDGGYTQLTATSSGWRRELAPFESVLLHDKDSNEARAHPPIVRIPVPSACHVSPQSSNLLRLGDWEMTLIDADGNEGQTGQ